MMEGLVLPGLCGFAEALSKAEECTSVVYTKAPVSTLAGTLLLTIGALETSRRLVDISFSAAPAATSAGLATGATFGLIAVIAVKLKDTIKQDKQETLPSNLMATAILGVSTWSLLRSAERIFAG